MNLYFNIIDSISSLHKEKNSMDRRNFLKMGYVTGCMLAFPRVLFSDNSFTKEEQKFVKEALYYDKLPHKKIQCKLCPKECTIDDRERGYCGVRENREGTYYTLVYSRPCTFHTDPIEKKPLFHFHPGSLAFSIATAGCNVNCKFCQNWQISQSRPEQIRSIYMPPEKTADLAKNYNSISIAYTYSEPTIFYEYMLDTAVAAHEKNIKSVVVTAGYIQ